MLLPWQGKKPPISSVTNAVRRCPPTIPIAGSAATGARQSIMGQPPDDWQKKITISTRTIKNKF
jgi:hypothetical protein